jgi:hypothetical protein
MVGLGLGRGRGVIVGVEVNKSLVSLDSPDSLDGLRHII